MGVYKIIRPDGSIEYSDVPNGEGQVVDTASNNSHQEDNKWVKKAIKEVQKRVPELKDYFEYLDYLRNHNPVQFDRVLNELRQQDPKTWAKLQKYPQFRPLRETAIGLKAADRSLTAGVGLLADAITGSAPTGTVEKWLKSTVKESMKRDRYGPYAKVLGDKASTLPAPKPTTYSNSRLGQYLETEDARSVKAAKESAKRLESARAGMRTAGATVVTRTLSPVLDVGIGALDIDVYRGMSAIQGMRLSRQLVEKGVLTSDEALELPGMMARGEYGKVRELIEAGAQRAMQQK